MFQLSATKTELTVRNRELLTSGMSRSAVCEFIFSADWEGLAKTAVFTDGAVTRDVLLIEDNRCDIPWEVLATGGNYVRAGVRGSDGEGLVLPTIWAPLGIVYPGAEVSGDPAVPPTPTVYDQITADCLATRRQTSQDAADAAGAAASAQNAADAAAVSAAESADAAAYAAVSAAAAQTRADSAALSEGDAAISRQAAAQALADLLNMLGSDVATLVGGKIPIGQIPATATQEIYTVTTESQLTDLTAQRGDLAELIEIVDGKPIITKTWQCLGDAAVLANWVIWGTSYAVQAGNATTANVAEDAGRINGHRIVEMTAGQYALAVKDDDAYYLVYPEAV